MSQKQIITGKITFKDNTSLDNALKLLLENGYIRSRDDNNDKALSESFFVEDKGETPFNDVMTTNGGLTLYFPQIGLEDIADYMEDLFKGASEGVVAITEDSKMLAILYSQNSNGFLVKDITRELMASCQEEPSLPLLFDEAKACANKKDQQDLMSDVRFHFNELAYNYAQQLDDSSAAEINSAKWERWLMANDGEEDYVARHNTGESTHDDHLRLAAESMINGQYSQAADYILQADGDPSLSSINESIQTVISYGGDESWTPILSGRIDEAQEVGHPR